MYQNYNPHPKKTLTNDCVKRAITKVAGKDYEEVQRELNRYKKVTGAGTYNSNENWKHYVEQELKGIKISLPAMEGIPRMNGETFCREFPKGTYLLRMANHLVACIDGVIYDTWNCSEKCVYTAWKISN